MTIIPPEPMYEPSFWRCSYVIGVSNSRAGIRPPDGPPVWTALMGLSEAEPPQIPSTTCRSVTPIGISTSPACLTLPVTAKTLVPVELPMPMPANHSPPRRMIWHRLASDSTLLIIVGWPHRPLTWKTLVPVELPMPMPANHSPPRRMIWHRLASDSTLLIIVGWPHRPL